jgi:hypothetical protein
MGYVDPIGVTLKITDNVLRPSPIYRYLCHLQTVKYRLQAEIENLRIVD